MLRQLWPLQGGVIRIGPNTMLKFGRNMRAAEAYTMDYVRQNTRIPIPCVHDVFQDNAGKVYLVMDYIDAPELQRLWARLSPLEKSNIVEEVFTYLTELRGLPPPISHVAVAAIDGGPLVDTRLRAQSFGPFATIDDFHLNFGHTIIYTKLALLSPDDHRALEHCRRCTYRIVMTHSDIAPRNILVRDGHIVAILDWEFAGWYPDYWEFTRACESNWNMPDFWKLFQSHFQGQYDNELVMERVLSDHFTRC